MASQSERSSTLSSRPWSLARAAAVLASSLGVTLFQAVTGALPYEATSVLGMVTKHIREPVPSADEVNPDLPRPISEVIRRMMNKEPGERFASYDGLRVALSQAVGDRRIPRSQAETIMSFTPQAEEV